MVVTFTYTLIFKKRDYDANSRGGNGKQNSTYDIAISNSFIQYLFNCDLIKHKTNFPQNKPEVSIFFTSFRNFRFKLKELFQNISNFVDEGKYTFGPGDHLRLDPSTFQNL